MDKLALSLYHNGIVQFGDFTLRSGAKSKVYFDLRRLIASPPLIKNVVKNYIRCQLKDVDFDHVCGVAYTGIPLATVYSQITELPMLMVRKEIKGYGTNKLIEGGFKAGDKVILIDDVITSGGSIIETKNKLEQEGLLIEQIIVLVDRRPPETDRLNNIDGVPLSCLYTMEDLLERLAYSGVNIPFPRPTFLDRTLMTKCMATKKLYEIMYFKQTNLVFSADLVDSESFLKMVDLIGPEVCIVKTHMDIMMDFEYEKVIPPLLDMAKKHNFMILEDRKFADIGNTVKLQFTSGIHKISNWADLVTCHSLLGPGICQAFLDNCSDNQGILLLPQLSNKGNLIDSNYVENTIELAKQFPTVVAGIICQGKILSPQYAHLTPGVNIESKGDASDQQYNTPEDVIGLKGSDIIIVGRGIYQSSNPLELAKQYRKRAWDSYLKR